MVKSKWSALLTLLVVFLSGAMVGAFGYGLYVGRTVNGGSRRPNPEEVRRQRLNELRDALKLDESQLAKVNQAYDEGHATWERIEQTRRQNLKDAGDALHAKIRAALRPDQLALYEKLLAKWDAEREAERKKRGDQMRKQGGGSPPPPSK
jgi:hypothetical protein